MSKRFLFVHTLIFILTINLGFELAHPADDNPVPRITTPKLPLKPLGDGYTPGAPSVAGAMHDEPGTSPEATKEEPDISASWSGATVWMAGVSFSGGETFGGSISKGVNFFGSSLDDSEYVPVEIVFNGTDTTLCRTFRRDLGYVDGGVGKFPGSAWDVSDTGSPRRLNICFVEDNNQAPVNLMWDPDATGSPTYGKREYIYVMKSSYDGSGATYAGFNGLGGAPSMDILYNWWPRLNSGHTLMESLPSTLTITPYFIKNVRAIPDSGELILTWNYWESNADRFRIYSSTFSPPSTLLDSVSGSERDYVHPGLNNGTTYYYKIEAVDANDSIVGKSREFSGYPQEMASMMNLVGYWHERTGYGGIWGYTDSASGRQYALICSRPQGVSIVDIDTNPPVEVGFLPSITPNRDAKEVQVYRHYALTVKESEPMQVWDISDVTSPVQVATIQPDGGSGAHTCLVDGNYVYVVGNHNFGGVEIFDISNPAAPSKVGEFQPFYYHDAVILGNKYYACGIYGDGIDILDISNKAAPFRIDLFNYSGSGPHNIELTPDGNYAFVGDEIGSSGNWTRTFDVSDPNNVTQVGEIIVDSQAIVHNCYLKTYGSTDYLHIAHYTEGTRVWDVSDPLNPFEVAYYDTYQPAGYGYLGNWTAYPMPNSRKIVASDLQTGFYVLELDSSLLPTCTAIPGDANASGTLSLADAIADVNYIFNKPGCAPQPQCWLSNLICRGDWDGTLTVTLSDVIRGVNYIFNKPGGPWNPLPIDVCCQPLP